MSSLSDSVPVIAQLVPVHYCPLPCRSLLPERTFVDDLHKLWSSHIGPIKGYQVSAKGNVRLGQVITRFSPVMAGECYLVTTRPLDGREGCTQ